MTKRVIGVGAVAILLCAVVVWSQAPAGPPQPGPEHKRLGVFVGKWTGSGEMKPGPWGPGGKMTWTETCEWFEGGFSLVCRSEGSGPMGKMKSLAILGYNNNEKHYVYFATNSMGEVETSKGTVQGKTWNWTSEGKVAGKSLKGKFTINEQSNDAYTFKWETSVDGGPWSVAMEGKSTRAK
ncbi:MAG: DUF1579 family protein [Terriglobia bacterium]